MKQVVIDHPHSVKIKNVPVPRIKADEVLVKNLISGVSLGTERVFYEGQWGTPVYPGYEAVGRVVRRGRNVTEPAVGDLVVCLGRHAEYVCVPAVRAVRVPAGLKPEEATFAILGTTAAHAVERSELKHGGSAAVIGLGVVGQMLLQYLRIERRARTVGVDILEEKCRTAAKLGADEVINTATVQGRAALKRLSREGVDVAIEVAGGAPSAVATAFQLAREHGRVLIMGGGAATGGEVRFPYRDHFFRKELEIAASRAWGPNGEKNFRKTIRYLAQGKLATRGIRITRLPYTQVGDVYENLRRGKGDYFHVVLEWPA